MGQVVVVDYDLSWPAQFEALKSPLVPVLAEVAISIEHACSTAVPGLAAKPVIDLDIVVAEHHVDEAVARLATLGYEHLGDRGIPHREAFRPPPGSAAHHLYVCPSTSSALANHLAVRDYLRSNASAARAYGELKKRLAFAFAEDVDGYVEAKTEFLTAILRERGFRDELLQQIERANRRINATD